ncbi:hypothetical protein KEM55_006150, partial [Ascosphaera atra]
QIKWIRGKLWNGLLAAESNGRLFVVNTTDPSNWDHDALEPAVEVTRAFLRDETLPNPLDMSDFARATLEPLWQNKTSATPAAPLSNITCGVCKVTVLSGDQWEGHINSSRHRKCVKLTQKREEMLKNNPHYRAAREQRQRSSSPS